MNTTESREFAACLADLLRNERFAMADFLVALAEYDRKRGWIALGYSSLFAFLRRRLGLSKAATYYRVTAVQLIQRYPEVLPALKDGKLCITTMASLRRVLTPENAAAVLPRFFSRSGLDAKQLAAELAPAATVPSRTVVTVTPVRAMQSTIELPPPPKVGSPGEPTFEGGTTDPVPPPEPTLAPEPLVLAPSRPLRAEPLTATETRLHLTVSPAFLKKLESARLALSHSMPGAAMEDVLTAGLDLILAKDAKRKAMVKRPRPANDAAPTSDAIPAAVRREVWKRDEGKCQYPLDGGGVCGSELRTELDHIHPESLGGPPTVENLRVTCEFHNQLAAREKLGDTLMDAYARNPRQAGLFGEAQAARQSRRRRGDGHAEELGAYSPGLPS